MNLQNKYSKANSTKWDDVLNGYVYEQYNGIGACREYAFTEDLPNLPWATDMLREVIHQMYEAETPCLETMECALLELCSVMGVAMPDKPSNFMAKPKVPPDSPFFNLAVELTKSINQ